MQGRVSVKHSGSGSLGAAAADEDVSQQSPLNVRPGTLAAILQIFADAQPPISVCIAGGQAIETTGEFVFAIRADSEEEEERELDRALGLLEGLEAYKNSVYHGELKDDAGELLKFLRKTIPQQELIHEIFVGTPDPKSKLVLVQVTTLRVGDAIPAPGGAAAAM